MWCEDDTRRFGVTVVVRVRAWQRRGWKKRNLAKFIPRRNRCFHTTASLFESGKSEYRDEEDARSGEEQDQVGTVCASYG